MRSLIDFRAGFTLVEVMISVAIMAMMTTLAWSAFSVTVRGKQRAEAIADRYQQVRLALDRMCRELSMAYLSKNDHFGALVPRTMFVGERRNPVDELMFSNFAHMRLREDARESDQSLIRYYAIPAKGEHRAFHLVRRESRRLGGTKPGQEGPAYVVLENVRELHYEYFDIQNNEWRESWDTRSADGQVDRLPEKVRIVLTVLDEAGRDLTLRTAARLNVKDPIMFSAGPS